MPPIDPLLPLIAKARLRTYPKGQILLYQGDMPTEIFILKSGTVKVHNIDDQGNEKILHLLTTETIFPLMYSLGQQKEVAWFYSALTDVEVYMLAYDDLRSRMEQNGKAGMYVLSQILKELHELFVRVDSLGRTLTPDKITAALKFLAVHHADALRGGWRHVRFPVSHQLLADMTGVTRESVSVAMKQLEQAKLVRYPQLTVLEINFSKLVRA